MNVAVEVVAAEATRKQIAAAKGAWPSGVRFVSSPSKRAVGARLLVDRLEEIGEQGRYRELLGLLQRVRRLHAAAPLVLLATGKVGRGAVVSTALLQALALVARRATPASKLDPYIVPDHDAFRRLVLARRHGAEKELIASATIETGMLSVWSCEPRLFQCPVNDIPALAALTPDALATFEVSETGTRIHWPEGDIDINMDTVREHADDEYRRAHEAKSRREAARHGKAIRALRERRGLSQKAIPGLSDRQVRRLERGHTVPHSSSLKKLAEAHDMEVNVYLAELAKLSAKKSRPRAG